MIQNNITAGVHPFKPPVKLSICSKGHTISTMLDKIADENKIVKWFTSNVYVEINGQEIDKSQYDTFLIDESQHIVVQFRVPEGGGDDKGILGSLLMIVVAVVATVYGGPLGAAITGMAETSATAIAVGSSMIMLAGSLAVNALVPPAQLSGTGLSSGSNVTESNVYSISGMRNVEPQYKALPMILGTVRYAPPFGAKTYTRIEGNDQYLHADLVWGHGPLQIEDVKLGDTLVSEYEDVEIQTNLGYPSDNELKLYPDDVFESTVSAVLEKDTPVERSTIDSTEGISLDIVFPKGLIKYNEQGDRQTASVNVLIEYRKEGDANWAVLIDRVYSGETSNPKRFSEKKDVRFDPSVYELRVTRKTAEPSEGDRVYDEVVWATLRSIKYKDPVTFDCPIAETQLVIRATDQLSGGISDLNGKVTSICLDYDYLSKTWVERATNNPASLVRHVWQGPGCAVPLKDDEIDLVALEEFHDFCRINKMYYNKVHDGQMSVQSVINDICHAGRASFVMVGSNVRSVVIDKEREFGPVQLFTPSNSSNFSSSKKFLPEVHGYRCQFNNEEVGYQEDEIFVFAEGYTKANATLYEALQMPGMTDPDQVQKMGKYHLATRRYRPETFTWTTDWEHIVCGRGDLVRISHYAINVGKASGRVLEATKEYILLDNYVELDPTKDYGLSIRTEDRSTGQSRVVTMPILRGEGRTNKLFFEGKGGMSAGLVMREDLVMSAGNMWVPAERGDVYAFGLLNEEAVDVIVTAKVSSKDMKANIVAVQYSWNEIQQYLDGYYPDFNSGIDKDPYKAQKPRPPAPVIVSVNSDDSTSVINDDGSINNRAIIMVEIPSGVIPVTSVIAQVSFDDRDTWLSSDSVDPSTPIVFNNVANKGVNAVFRVASVSELGVLSSWTYTGHEIKGKTNPPSPVKVFTVKGLLFSNQLLWELPAERDVRHVEIWCASGVNDRGNAALLYEQIGDNWVHYGLDQEIEYFYWLRVVDTSGNESEYYPASPLHGIGSFPSADPEQLLKNLNQSITQGQLAADLNTKIDDSAEGVKSIQQLSNNEWTVKIQEDGHISGVGLLMYPNLEDGQNVEEGDYFFWEEDKGVYKAKSDFVANPANNPPNATFWDVVPNGRKSQFIVQAQEFAVVTQDGSDIRVPFQVTGNKVGMNADLIVNGTITAEKFKAGEVTTWSLKSINYVVDAAGYHFDAVTGKGYLNDFELIAKSEDSAVTVKNSAGDRAVLSAGDLNFFYFGDLTPYKAVRGLETKVVDNGVEFVTAQKYSKAPNVLVSIADLGLYKSNYSHVNQKIVCSATEPVETSPGSRLWKVTPTAQLQIDAGSQGVPLQNIALSCSKLVTDGLTRIYKSEVNNMVTTGVTKKIRIYGSFTYAFSWSIGDQPIGGNLYVVIDGVKHVIATGLKGAGTISVDKTFDVYNTSHTVGISSDGYATRSEGDYRCIRGWIGSCSYHVQKYDDGDGQSCYGSPIVYTGNINISTSLTCQSFTDASAVLASGSVQCIIVGS